MLRLAAEFVVTMLRVGAAARLIARYAICFLRTSYVPCKSHHAIIQNRRLSASPCLTLGISVCLQLPAVITFLPLPLSACSLLPLAEIVKPLLQRIIRNLETGLAEDPACRVHLYFSSEAHLQGLRNVLLISGLASNRNVANTLESLGLLMWSSV